MPVSLRARWPLAVAGALVMTMILAVAAPAPAQADDPQGAPVAFTVSDRHLSYGQRVVAHGRASDAAGRTVTLVRRTATGWATLATARVAGDGRFRLSARLTRSAELRVLVAPAAGTDQTADAATAPPGASAPVAVAARVSRRRSRMDVLAGGRGVVRGVLRPGYGGRAVALQVRTGGGWNTVDRDRTDGLGRFVLRAPASRTGSRRVRVTFAGDLANAATVRSLGRLNVYRRAAVSWYGPGLYGSHLACGGTLGAGTVGVANKSLPCGTRVTLHHAGRTVRVPVIDRGPYAGAREYDLTEATAQRLGFHGAGTIWVTR